MASGQVFTVCKNSLAIFLGIAKSHNRMYLKWTSQNLTSFANSVCLCVCLSLPLSLSHSLFLENAFVLPSYKYMSPFKLQVVCTDFIAKMISHWREWNAIRSPLIMKHVFATVIHFSHCFKIGSLHVSGVSALKRVKPCSVRTYPALPRASNYHYLC